MPIDQHPIPQQITSYEFKLVGDMTIKQFGKAAVGIVGGLIIWGTPLFILIKLPLALTIGAAGLAAAFVPFSDRPLEKWAMSFFKSLYSPTLFVWKKTIDPNWLDIDYSKKFELDPEDEDKKPKKEMSKVQEFIDSIPARESGQINANDIEKTTKKQAKKDVLLDDIRAEEEKAKLEALAKAQAEIKPEEALKINDDSAAGLELRKEKMSATNVADFGAIPMPNKPTVPNILVGMVLDKAGKIVPEAIVEIQDEHGNASRVLKTNPLGQFRTSTPLSNGIYLLITEKQGHAFDRVKVTFNNTILEPVRIQAVVT